MPRTHQPSSRQAHPFSPEVLHDMSRADNLAQEGLEDVREERTSASSRLQQISAFLPLSRWIARVQGSGSGTPDA